MAELRCECVEVTDDLRELLNPPAEFAGMRFRAGSADADKGPPSGASPNGPPAPLVETDLRPRYDAVRRVLLLDGMVLLAFRQRAKNQEALLIAFQEEEWPEYLDDPLPGSRVNAVKRLQDAVYALNTTLETEGLRRAELSADDRAAYTLQFHIDESGERLRWQLARVTPHDADYAPRAGRARLFAG